jgi:hypothetical protein
MLYDGQLDLSPLLPSRGTGTSLLYDDYAPDFTNSDLLFSPLAHNSEVP